MSTRSHIGIINKDGSIEVVYCHHDGYLEFTGKRLLDNHNSVPLARKLIDIGNMSFVGSAMIDADIAMRYKFLFEYFADIKKHFTDIEYFYLYAVDKSIFNKVGWWVSKDGQKWDMVKNELLNVKMMVLV
jgi:hypothetical protein